MLECRELLETELKHPHLLLNKGAQFHTINQLGFITPRRQGEGIAKIILVRIRLSAEPN